MIPVNLPRWWATLCLALVLASTSAQAQGTIVGSPHDLSTATTDRVCAFCHTPHLANTDAQGPLWNRVYDVTKSFTFYSSPTMDAAPPTAVNGESMNCLGCHDGSLATVSLNGNPVSDKHDLVNAPGSGGVPDTSSMPSCGGCHFLILGGNPLMEIGTDLSDDHPVSIAYPTLGDPDFNTPPDPSSGWAATDGLKLFEGRIECPTCHNVHDPTLAPFLRVDVDASNMCRTCHVK